MKKNRKSRTMIDLTKRDIMSFNKISRILLFTSFSILISFTSVKAVQNYSLSQNSPKDRSTPEVGNSAQQKKVSGKISDTDGYPLPGVTVIIKGSTNGTVSDSDGNYSLNADPNETLIFSFIGYTTREVPIGGKSTIDVILKTNVVGLEEVVAIGYGTTKKRDITGSVSSISAKDLLQAPISSIDAGMRGKMAGVTIQNTSGAPGQQMKIRVRGGSSINYSNEPLYVIDGFIGADIKTINPSDIASIDVLKDASATAVYGSRGANGVILITTNAPKAGDLVVSFDANTGISHMVNEYEILPAGEMAELINLQDASKNKVTPSFSSSDLSYFNTNGGTNWADLITQTGVKQNYTLNLNGGSEKLQYFLSANYLDDKGIIKNSYYKRYSVRSNISAKISDKIDMKFNTYGIHTDSQNNGIQNNGTSNAYGRAVKYPQFWPARDANGDYMTASTYNTYNGHYQAGSEETPEQYIRQNQESPAEKITSNLDLTIELPFHLSLFASGAGSFSTGFYGSRDLVNGVTYTRSNIGAQQTYSRGNSILNTEVLSYENDFNKHHLKVSAVYEYSQSSWQSEQAKVNTLSTTANEWYILTNGKPSLTTSSYAESKMRSYMGRINYSFADKYLLTASMRADGSSVFQPDNRWGYFPSAALAWRASEEQFIKDLGFIDNLKVRAGFGSTGNTAVSTYSTLSTLDYTTNDYLWYTFNNTSAVSGVIPGKLNDPNLRWETTNQYNLGVDISVLGGKLSAVIDLYNKKSSDVIIDKTIPQYTGQSSFTSNLAEIGNKGFEFSVNWNIMQKNDFRWTTDFNVSRNVNEVLDLGGAESIFISSEEALGIWNIVGGNKFIVKKGESMGALYGLKAIGIWQADEATEALKYNSRPGEVKYEDLDNSGSLSGTDRQIIGHTAPALTYGIGTNIYYKNFDVAIQCIGQFGNDIYNFSRNIMNQELLTPDYRNRWSPTNTSSTQQIMPIGTDYSQTYVASQYVENGAFFKISNLSIGYTLPKSALSFLNISKLRIYGSANNLLTFTNYSGLDPEASSTKIDSDSQSGIDAFSYPLLRTFSAGISVTF